MKKIALHNIIKEVLEEKKELIEYHGDIEHFARTIRNRFFNFVERIGGNKEVLRTGVKYLFHEEDMPFMKVLLRQIRDEEGVFYEFTKKNREFSYREVHALIQAVLEEGDRLGWSEEDLKRMQNFLTIIFAYSPERSIARMRELVDSLSSIFKGFTLTEQSIELQKLQNKMQADVVVALVESALNSADVAELLYFAREDGCIDMEMDSPYLGEPFEIKLEYETRDREILQKIRGDPDLKQYLEKKLGTDVEAIFSHVDEEK